MTRRGSRGRLGLPLRFKASWSTEVWPQMHGFYVTSSLDSPTTSYDWFCFCLFFPIIFHRSWEKGHPPGVSGIFLPIDSTLPWEGCTTSVPMQKQRSTKISPGYLIEQGTQLLEEECFAAASGRLLRLDNWLWGQSRLHSETWPQTWKSKIFSKGRALLAFQSLQMAGK